MKKLVEGIAEFRRTLTPAARERFAELALGQAPDCLFVACSDSRVVPNLFASTNPGDLFVVRNVGNLVPGPDGATADTSVVAALEFAVERLGVGDIVVCGHSECGAMRALLEPEAVADLPGLQGWLDAGRASLRRLRSSPGFAPELSAVNRLSQLHVLEQLDHLRADPRVARRIAAGTLTVHGWWFDIARAEVLAWDADAGEFRAIGG